MALGSRSKKGWVMLLTGLTSIHLFKIFLLVTMRSWVRKMVNVTENITRKLGSFANLTVRLTTLEHTEYNYSGEFCSGSVQTLLTSFL